MEKDESWISYRIKFGTPEECASAHHDFPEANQQRIRRQRSMGFNPVSLASHAVIRRALRRFPDADRDIFASLGPEHATASMEVPLHVLDLAQETNADVLFSHTYLGPRKAHP